MRIRPAFWTAGGLLLAALTASGVALAVPLKNPILLQIFTTLLLALLLLLILLSRKTLIAPLLRIHGVATALLNGQSALRLHEHGLREVRDLALSFNELSNQRDRLIVEHSRRVEQIKSSEAYMGSIIAGLPDIFMVFGSEGYVINSNKRFMEITGLSNEDFIGLTPSGFLDLDDVEVFNTCLRESAADIRPVFLDRSTLVTKGGGRIPYAWSFAPVDAPGAESNSVTAIGRDMTPVESLMAEIRSARDMLEVKVHERTSELEDANRRLQEQQAQMIQAEKMAGFGILAAGIAHEINNPTGFILSNLQTLKSYVTDLSGILNDYKQLIHAASHEAASAKERILKREGEVDLPFILEDIPSMIDESIDGALRIKKIVQSLKEFARPDTGEMSRAGLNDIAEQTLTIIWNEIKYKADVVKEYGDIPFIVCQPQQISQVFMNVLINASHAILDKGVIAIKTYALPNEVAVEIKDTGEGIPPDKLQKIFDPFYTTKPVGKGTGLGLHICDKIISSHGGRIEVESEVGKGTTFRILLPLDGKPDV